MQSELEKVAWFQYFALLLIKKKTKFCKQQKIGGFEYLGDSDVVNKLFDIFCSNGYDLESKTCIKI